MRHILLAAAAVGMAACATAVGTAYGPADSKGFGYSETRIEENRFRVTFAGDGATPPDAVEDMALLRAAELARSHGYDWFRVTARSLDAEEKGGVSVGAGFGSGGYGRRGGASVGVGGNFGSVGAKPFYTARLEAVMGRGEAPDGGDIYDVRSVIEAIRARIGA